VPAFAGSVPVAIPSFMLKKAIIEDPLGRGTVIVQLMYVQELLDHLEESDH
jgi:hypothetical protein